MILKKHENLLVSCNENFKRVVLLLINYKNPEKITDFNIISGEKMLQVYIQYLQNVGSRLNCKNQQHCILSIWYFQLKFGKP